MEYADYVESYAAKSDDELLRLQLASKHLTLHASAALTNELAKRGISGAEELNAFREREAQRHREEAKKMGSLFIASRFGIGRWYFGKRDRTVEVDKGVERFKTTVFILLLWFPLIPTGSYLIEKKPSFFSSKVTVLKRLPLDWAQIMRVWAVAVSGVVLLIWLLRHL